MADAGRRGRGAPMTGREPAAAAQSPARGPAAESAPVVVLTSVSSDAHTWNLVFLQLLMEEHGAHVVNLGACVPDEEVLAACRENRPDLLVVSSVNGHGATDGARLARRLRAEFDRAELPAVIGGKLGVTGTADAEAIGSGLRQAGYDAVFQDADLDGLVSYLRLCAPATPRALEAGQ